MEYLEAIITSVGGWAYIILFVVVFLESFPPTFILPGDSLLFLSGVLASQGQFSMPLLMVTFFLAGVTSYIFGYHFGVTLRNFIIQSNDKYWFKKRHLDYTENFYNKYGAKMILIGRFVTVVRSFGPTFAGTAKMDYKKFLNYVVWGGLVWAVSLPLLGYYLGGVIPNPDSLLMPIMIGVVLVSVVPAVADYVYRKYWKKS
jgi:membrane-associated protein